MYYSDTSLSRLSNDSIHGNQTKTTYDYLINTYEDNKRKNDNLPIKASRELVETIIEATESIISCVQEDVKELNTSNQHVLGLYQNVSKQQTSRELLKDRLKFLISDK